MTKVVDDDRARQATPGRPILYILIASLALVGVYLITMVGWSGTAPDDRPATTSSTSAPGPAREPAGGTPPASPAAPEPAAPTRTEPVNPQGGSTPQ